MIINRHINEKEVIQYIIGETPNKNQNNRNDNGGFLKKNSKYRIIKTVPIKTGDIFEDDNVLTLLQKICLYIGQQDKSFQVLDISQLFVAFPQQFHETDIDIVQIIVDRIFQDSSNVSIGFAQKKLEILLGFGNEYSQIKNGKKIFEGKNKHEYVNKQEVLTQISNFLKENNLSTFYEYKSLVDTVSVEQELIYDKNPFTITERQIDDNKNKMLQFYRFQNNYGKLLMSQMIEPTECEIFWIGDYYDWLKKNTQIQSDEKYRNLYYNFVLKFYWNRLPDILDSNVENLFTGGKGTGEWNRLSETVLGQKRQDYSYHGVIDPNIKLVQNEEKDITVKKDIEYIEWINKASFKVQGIKTIAKKDKLNLQTLFRVCKLNDNVPYVRLQTNTDKQYKINLKKLNIKKKELKGIELQDIYEWTELKQYLKQKEEQTIGNQYVFSIGKGVNYGQNLQFKMFFDTVYDKSSFLTITLNENYAYSVDYVFGNNMNKIGISDVIQSFDRVNEFINHLNDLLRGGSSEIQSPYGLYYLDKNFMNMNTNQTSTQMQFMAVSFIMTVKGKAFHMQDIMNMTKKMFPFFYSYDEKNGKFYYKRVDNFDKGASLQKFIIKQYGRKKENIINDIIQYFGYDEMTALAEYNKIMSQKLLEINRNENNSFNQKSAVGHAVTLNANKNFAKCELFGQQNLQSIIKAIKHIVILFYHSGNGQSLLYKGLKYPSAVPRQKYDQNSSFNVVQAQLQKQSVQMQNNYEDYSIQQMLDGMLQNVELEEDIKSNQDFDDIFEEMKKIKQEKQGDTNGERDEDGVGEEVGNALLNGSKPITENDYNRYTIQQLRQADMKLFNFKDTGKYERYSRQCQSYKRQPIVVDNQTMDVIDKKYKTGYTNFVKTGSSMDKVEQNNYMCPQVWCPKSKIPMTIEQLKKNNGKCYGSDPLEKPIILNGSGETHYVGLLPFSKHPNNYCMPCCFKKLKDTDKTQSSCIKALQRNEGHENDIDYSGVQRILEFSKKSNLKKEFKYIKGWEDEQAEYQRFSLFPPTVGSLFSQNTGSFIAGFRPDGTGNISKKTQAFVRFGTYSSMKFYNTIIYSLDDKSVENVQQLIDKFYNGVSVLEYLYVAGGQTARAFMNNDTKDYLLNDNFQKFKLWFSQQHEYKRIFQLEDFENGFVSKIQNIQKWVEQFLKEGILSEQFMIYQREYIIYEGFQRFREFIRSERVNDDYQLVLPFFEMKTRYFNPKETKKVIVIEQLLDGTPSIQCQKYSYSDNQRYFLVYKHRDIFEPIFTITNTNNQMVNINMIFDKRNYNILYNHIPDINKILNNLIYISENNCKRISEKNILNKLYALGILESVQYQVLDFNMSLIGYVVQGMFLPLPFPYIFNYKFNWTQKDNIGDKQIPVVYAYRLYEKGFLNIVPDKKYENQLLKRYEELFQKLYQFSVVEKSNSKIVSKSISKSKSNSVRQSRTVSKSATTSKTNQDIIEFYNTSNDMVAKTIEDRFGTYIQMLNGIFIPIYLNEDGKKNIANTRFDNFKIFVNIKDQDTRYAIIDRFNGISQGYYRLREFLNDKYSSDKTIKQFIEREFTTQQHYVALVKLAQTIYKDATVQKIFGNMVLYDCKNDLMNLCDKGETTQGVNKKVLQYFVLMYINEIVQNFKFDKKFITFEEREINNIDLENYIMDQQDIFEGQFKDVVKLFKNPFRVFQTNINEMFHEVQNQYYDLSGIESKLIEVVGKTLTPQDIDYISIVITFLRQQHQVRFDYNLTIKLSTVGDIFPFFYNIHKTLNVEYGHEIHTSLIKQFFRKVQQIGNGNKKGGDRGSVKMSQLQRQQKVKWSMVDLFLYYVQYFQIGVILTGLDEKQQRALIEIPFKKYDNYIVTIYNSFEDSIYPLFKLGVGKYIFSENDLERNGIHIHPPAHTHQKHNKSKK